MKVSGTKQNIQNIWMVTREYGSLAGVGGVKDMVRQLAEALANRKKRVHIVLPCYGFMDPRRDGFKPTKILFDVDMNYADRERRETVRIWQSAQNPTIYLADSRRFREKMGVYTYTADEEAKDPNKKYGSGHIDYFATNVLLQKTALALMVSLNQQPDIIHCHDGHTALLPALIREQEGYRHYFRKTGCVVTIHNAGVGYHQEVADLHFARAVTGLPSRVIWDNLLDGAFDPLLAASPYAQLNTVSENYARELQETYDDEQTGWLGHRLMARGVRLKGITNGITPSDFDPTNPQKMGLAHSFDPRHARQGLAGKNACKEALIETLREGAQKTVSQFGNLKHGADTPLFTFIGRLTSQKGVDKMVEALKNLLPIHTDFQILILGSGAKELEQELITLSQVPAFQGRICLLLGYDPNLANQIYAAGDFFLVPSQYEPCGLTDFMAQLFGNLPIVHGVGGLVKVVHDATGFVYTEHSSEALCKAMTEALEVYQTKPKKKATMQQTAVTAIHKKHTWDKVVLHYLDLYREACPATP